MNCRFFTIALFLFFFVSCESKREKLRPDISPPTPAARPFEIISKHGHQRIDNYYWLNKRKDSAVINYLKAENAYTDTMMAHTKELQQKLFNEMKGRIKEKDESAPYRLGNYFYYTRYEEDSEYPIFCRKKNSLNETEEIVANGNELSKGHSFFNIQTEMSPNHNIATLITDTVGRRFYTIMFKDMNTGSILPDKIGGTEGQAVWFNDNKTIVYIKQDPITLIGNKVYKHTLGTDVTKDVLVYHEKDSTLECYLYKTSSYQYIVISSGRTDANVQHFINADDPASKLSLIQPLHDNVEYFMDHGGNEFLIRTNLDAKNYRLVSAPIMHPGKANWKDIIPNRDNILLEGVSLFKDHMALQESSEGLNKIRIIHLENKSEHTIDFDEEAYTASIGYNPEFNTDVIRFNYQSMTTPNSTYDYSMTTREKKLMKQQEVLGGFKASDYQTERVMTTARDGARIPVSLVYRKDKFKKDGKSPCLQFAYGAYGISMDPYFSSSRLSLLDRGFVYVIAHIRGGQEMGGKWYEDGRMMKKKNTFYDFIDCSEFLISNGYTSAEKLFAHSGSAGGLLMGVILNLRPELYKGIVAEVPFVDVVTTMMDETIPLTTFEWKEWGNPHTKEEYDYMLSYSPYDNIEKKDYTNLLVLTGLHDSQVQYWEPAKWVAKLRTLKTDDNIILLHTNMTAGHGGASGRFEALKDVALYYAFILDLAGIDE